MTTAQMSPAAGNGGAQNSNADGLSTKIDDTTVPAGSQQLALGDDPQPASVLAVQATEAYITSLRTAGTLHTLTPHEVNAGLRAVVNRFIAAQNAKFNPRREPNHPATVPYYAKLGHNELASLLLVRHHVARIAPSQDAGGDEDLDLLAVYDDDPASPRFGTYVSSHATLRRLARSYSPDLSAKHDFPELLAVLGDRAPRVHKGVDRDLIPVANGVFHYGTKELLPFDPSMVFVSKLAVAYRPNAKNPVIPNPEGCIADLHVGDASDPCTPVCTTWDVESWMASLSDDPDLVDLLWEVTGAVCRPYVSWSKAAFFFSEQGNNGKGSLIHLLRQLTGSEGYASIKLVEFGKDFMLEPLTAAMSILVDENNVGSYIDQAAEIKAVITHDVISINRKFKTPIAYQFHGFMVQCLNEKPRIRDNSNSFWRRALAIPFEKSFEGVERKYIKDDYLIRPDVLEYVLHRVLHTDYYELSAPEATKIALDDIKDANDPVRLFWAEFHDQFVWELVPRPFLYDLYRAWLARTNPTAKPLGSGRFIDALVKRLEELHKLGLDLQWTWTLPGQAQRSTKIRGSEPLIAEYALTPWVNKRVPPSDRKRYCMPHCNDLAREYRGLLRQPLAVPAAPTTTGGPTGPLVPITEGDET